MEREEIDKADSISEYLRQKYLVQEGWEYKCDNILARWFWEKEIEGKHFTLSKKDALTMQMALEDIEQN